MARAVSTLLPLLVAGAFVPLISAHGFGSPHGSGNALPGSETSGLNALLRELYGGSLLRKFFHWLLDEPLPDKMIGAAKSPVKHLPNGQMEQTFIGPPITLINGHIGNKWLPIDWPQGHIAVQAFSADVVKAGLRGEVPDPEPCCGGKYVASRDEVFMHHWTVNKWQLPSKLFKSIVAAGGLEYHLSLSENPWVVLTEFLGGAGLNEGANGPCYDANLHLYFGIGNEVRSKTKEGKDEYEFPDPYGIEFDGETMRNNGEFMVLNTHLIDIRDVRNKRACTECQCSELGTHGFLNTSYEGGLSCCHSTTLDGGKCPLDAYKRETNATYYTRYTVRWRNFSSAIKPLEVIAFDATDNNTKWGDWPTIPGGFEENHSALISDPVSESIVNDGRSGDYHGMSGCHIEYYVPAKNSSSKKLFTLRNSWQVPFPIEVVFLRNHFHAPGLNMTSFWGGIESQRCIGQSTYDENNNLVDISPCTYTCETSKQPTGKCDNLIRRGERLYTEAVYDQDDLPHYGVMAMAFVYAYVPREQDFHI